MSRELEERIEELTASLVRRDAVLSRLRQAYADLESAAPLRELGQASSFITHEIKNYMMVISGYAALLLRSKTLSDKERGMVGNIAQTAAKLQEFSTSVQESARTAQPYGAIEETDLLTTLRRCADTEFADRAARVSVRYADADMPPDAAVLINGNTEKLSRAFACAFNNSFEAGARKIDVSICVRNYVALVTIDDDGEGCGADIFPNLSKTFFTTKHGQDGMGIGLCTLRSVVQAQGGNVSLYSKNALGGGSGLSVQITIPASKRLPSPVSACETALVRDGFDNVADILKILRNVKVIPRMLSGGDAAAETDSSLTTIILAAPAQAAELRSREQAQGAAVKILAIEKCGGGALAVTDADGTRALFTEEYVARYMRG